METVEHIILLFLALTSLGINIYGLVVILQTLKH